jgi:hypothetical protein
MSNAKVSSAFHTWKGIATQAVAPEGLCTAPSLHRPPAEHAVRLGRDNTSLGFDWRIARKYGALLGSKTPY